MAERTLVSRIRQYFFTGIAVFLPLVVTILVFQYLWNVADSLIVHPVYQALPITIDEKIAVWLIKSLILLVVLVMICILGFAANHLVLQQLIRLGESVVLRVPMVNKVYSVLKEISATFLSGKRQKDLFRSAVLIEYPRKGLRSIAFVTKNNHPVIQEKTGEEMVSVFVPTTPNPTSGVLIFLPRSEVVELPFSVEEAIKLVISAGALTGRALPSSKS